MAEFVKIGTTADMPEPGEAREFQVNGRTICVANLDGAYAAMDNVCIHRGGPLGQGSVERGKVVCPWHGWEFDPLTGAAAHNPQHRMTIYELRLEGNDVLVRLRPLLS